MSTENSISSEADQPGELAKPLLSDDDANNATTITASMTRTTYHEEYKPTWLIALALLPPILPLFWKYHVHVDDDKLSFGYSTSWTSKTVSRNTENEIVSEPFDIHPIKQWGGWGIRLRLGSPQTGYIASGGSGVLIKINHTNPTNGVSEESHYVFSCQDPETVCEILNNNNNKRNIVDHQEDMQFQLD